MLLYRTTRPSGTTLITDSLLYTYAGNRLTNVRDRSAATTLLFTEGTQTTTATEYTYDASGNMTADLNKGITIDYNFQNLPTRASFTATKFVSMLYDARGIKLKYNTVDGAFRDSTVYVAGINYRNGVASTIGYSEGFLRRSPTGTYEYFPTLTDYQGSTRSIMSASGSVIQRENYYPYGGSIKNLNFLSAGEDFDEKYNGKELLDKFNLNLYDYGARYYDPALTRWLSLDPHAERYFSWTPYNYVFNNPVLYVDPDGMDGRVTRTGSGSKDDPYVYTITANYYYGAGSLTKEEVQGLNDAIAEYNGYSGGAKKGEDGSYSQVRFNLSATEVEADQVSSEESESNPNAQVEANVKAAGDRATGDTYTANDGNQKSYGNVVGPGVSNENSMGYADNIRNLGTDRAGIAQFFSNYPTLASSSRSIFRGIFVHEIGHNLSGVHGDGSAMNLVQVTSTTNQITTGGQDRVSSSVTVPSVNNAFVRVLFGRIDVPKYNSVTNRSAENVGEIFNVK